jgi:hypothetical protein
MERVMKFNMNSCMRSLVVSAGLSIVTAVAVAGPVSAAAAAIKTPPVDVTASFYSMAASPSSFTVVEPGQATPVTLATTSSTLFSGVCADCGQTMTFKLTDVAKPCWLCPCAAPASECVTHGTKILHTMGAILQALPRGSELGISFNTPGKSDSGVSCVQLEGHEVLLAVDGNGSLDDASLLKVAAPFGAKKAEFLANGRQIHLALSHDWTAKAEASLEKSLANAGVKVAGGSTVSQMAMATGSCCRK